MRNLILIAGVVAAIGVPTFADAASCERRRSTNKALGTVAGAVAGGLLGSAIDGGRNNTGGIIVGGAAGAYAGNQLAKGKPCPTGYYRTETRSSARRSDSGARPVAARRSNCTWETESYRDAYGNVSRRQVQVCR